MSRPPPPPPPPSATRRPTVGKNSVRAEAPTYPIGSFGIGVEVEFLLQPRENIKAADDVRQFSKAVASSYNAFMDQSEPGPGFAEWSLDSDSTIEMPKKGRAPWGLESISPIFRAHEGSRWRQHVEFMWRFLLADFHVDSNASCGTHVHLSRVGGYSLSDLKKICQSLIHFEPAFEAILPEERLGNEYGRSNWLDNMNFGHQNLSRRQSIAIIQRVSTMRELVLLMNPDHDKMFGWNFLYLLNNPHGTIEFRRGAASNSVQDVFIYIEIAMSFLEASVRLGDVESLKSVPATVGGLQWFIQAAKLPDGIPGLFDSRYLKLFFAEKNQSAFREPRPLGILSPYKLNKLNRKKEEDKRKNVAMVKMLQEPYWS
ncbi:hypothetical protein PDIDSM_1569 [Penicillium digitatum]|nr:hypothetical protein PDIDSM_1569 [Penicillium digitatum]